MKIWTIILLILSGILVACTTPVPTNSLITDTVPTQFHLQTLSAQPTDTATPTIRTTAEQTQSASDYCLQLINTYQPLPGYKTYCDIDYRFAFDYPDAWRIIFVAGAPDTRNPIAVLKAQRFEATDMSNYIRVDTYRSLSYMSLLDQVQHFMGYKDREFPNTDYPSLTLGGQRAFAVMNCWQQDYSAVYLFFQFGEFYTIMELKAISQDGLDTNWQIARSLQTPSSSPDKNVIPQELIDDSHQLLDCNAKPTPITTPLTTLLPTWTVTPQGASDMDLARHTLLTFFTLLHDGRYAEAVPLYGGSYDGMRNNNPVIPPDDYAALFESSCTNQRPCLLVANIVEEEKVSQVEYRFRLEFVWIDGTLYKRGPCCGATETEMPTVWQFPYTVMKIDGQFKVMEEPVLMP